MNPLLISIAVKHLLARKRQSVVSLLGIVLGVAFFLAISSMMQGSETRFHPAPCRQFAAHHGGGRIPQSHAAARQPALSARRHRSARREAGNRNARHSRLPPDSGLHPRDSRRTGIALVAGAGAGRFCRQGRNAHAQRHYSIGDQSGLDHRHLHQTRFDCQSGIQFRWHHPGQRIGAQTVAALERKHHCVGHHRADSHVPDRGHLPHRPRAI